MKDQLHQIITDFENNKIQADVALNEIKRLTNKDVGIYELLNYWRAEDLETFIKRLTTEPIPDWRTISDERALELIKEILNNLSRDLEVVDRNCEALEKRYEKPTGSIHGKIFTEDVTDPNSILEYLKKDTKFYL